MILLCCIFPIYTKENPSIDKVESLKSKIENRIHDLKLKEYNIDEATLKSLRPKVSMKQYNLTQSGEEKSSNSGILYGLGFVLGILIYMFVLIYGIQIMQGVIDEKTSKIIEVIVSSVRPFQLMLGKIIGIASVGLLQFTIWIVLIFVLSSGTLAYFGLKMPQKQVMEQMTQQMANNEEMKQAMDQQNSRVGELLENISEIPFAKIAIVFVFYFLGGYLLYGALFAAVGSAVDSQQEAQQFQFPVTLPLLIGYLGLFMFILRDPHGPVSFWLSVIPFTASGNGGPHRFWRARLAIGAFGGIAGGRIFAYHLDCRAHLPGRHFNDRHQGELQGAGQVVYDENLIP
jgi:ABC-2 type transport system permease protein